jgi:predicted site-specific integrase-resolvase
MVKKAPEVQPGHIYNKSETAKLLGISRGTLRKYTRLRRIEPQLHTLNGAEYYTAEDILQAWESRMGKHSTNGAYATTVISRMNLSGQRSKSFESRINAFRHRGN